MQWYAHIFTQAYFSIAYMHKYAVWTINFELWIKEKSQDFVEKSQGFVKTLRRVAKIIQGFFSTKPWIVSTKSDVGASKSLFSTSAFVKIFRIFTCDTSLRLGRLQRYQQGIVDRIGKDIHPCRIVFGQWAGLRHLRYSFFCRDSVRHQFTTLL